MNPEEPVKIRIVDTLDTAGAEHCRQQLLAELRENKTVLVTFNRGSGYSAAFLDMVFGGLRQSNLKPTILEDHVRFAGEQDPSIRPYVALARQYMGASAGA